MSELKITDTNSANDSKGRALGLEGNEFLYVLIALVASLGLYLVLTLVLRVRLLPATVVVLPVFLGPFLWVLLLRHHKPPGYASDWCDQVTGGKGWGLTGRRERKDGHE